MTFVRNVDKNESMSDHYRRIVSSMLLKQIGELFAHTLIDQTNNSDRDACAKHGDEDVMERLACFGISLPFVSPFMARYNSLPWSSI